MDAPDGSFGGAGSSGGADAGTRPRVLVVDDERELADLFVAMLAPEFEATAVYSGEAAIEAIDGTFDVVLLDRKLPDRSGEAVLEALRSRGVDCPVVMVTGADPELAGIDAAFDDYLEKPVDREELEATVDRLAGPDGGQR